MRRARVVRPPLWSRFIQPRRKPGEGYADWLQRERLARDQWRDLHVMLDLARDHRSSSHVRRHQLKMAYHGFRVLEMPPDAFD